MFENVPARPDYAGLEEAVLRLWETTRAFDRLRVQTANGPRWSFLDGPITANNPMGVHHAWGRTYKDVYNRYHAMLGQSLRWQQGFDCQGLWVEVEVEKELGFRNKHEIEAYGVDRFVEACKARVRRFAAVQTEQSKRLGYWMDWDQSYFTMSDENNYSIWAFLKICHERGWLRRGHDVMPWCPRCGTALSEHEIATEGYVDKTHLAVTVSLPLIDFPGEHLLAWTTTAWTLPANVAAAVHPELQYVRVTRAGDTNRAPASYWVLREALARLPQPEQWRVVEERNGVDLAGRRYRTPFDDLVAQAGVEHRAVTWTEVNASEGTGVIHVAPGAGKEDFALGRELGLAVLAPLDEAGVYVDGYGWLTGCPAGAVAEQISAELAQRGLLFGQEWYVHRYPVCWRCGSELVFRLVDEWLIGMDELRPAMMEAARQATWLPGFGLQRELDWLRNMDDWMISKKRYWGLALPIYPCTACGTLNVIGSRSELRERAVAGWDHFDGHSPHRPWIDAVRIACATCGAEVERVPDVGNPWLDAGIVPFSTLGYAEDRQHWAEWFPADLVLESFPGQFRNWFYAMLAMSTALEGRSPFRTVLGYATVKDHNGDEMHKSKGNAIRFEEAVSWYGVEPLRWMFAAAPLERDFLFGREVVEATVRRLQPLWEVYRFFVTYARVDGWSPPPGTALSPDDASVGLHPLDDWLRARLNQLAGLANDRLAHHDVRALCQAVEVFLLDLSNWHVRRSRRRFWRTQGAHDGVADDKHAAYSTLHNALVTVARVVAPLLPFLSETLYQNLVCMVDPTAPVSVHLTGYPAAGSFARDERVLADTEVVRRAVGLGRVARRAAGVRVRQPLGRLLVAVSGPAEREALLRGRDELMDELNVKSLEVLEGVDNSRALLQDVSVKPNLRTLGPRLGNRLPRVRVLLAALDAEATSMVARRVERGKQVALTIEGEMVAFQPADLLVERHALEGYAVAQEHGMTVALDTRLTDDLRREGLARDLVRAVQEARKQAGLTISDRIILYLDRADADTAGDWLAVVRDWRDYLQAETLAVELVLAPPPLDVYSEHVALGADMVSLGVAPQS